MSTHHCTKLPQAWHKSFHAQFILNRTKCPSLETVSSSTYTEISQLLYKARPGGVYAGTKGPCCPNRSDLGGCKSWGGKDSGSLRIVNSAGSSTEAEAMTQAHWGKKAAGGVWGRGWECGIIWNVVMLVYFPEEYKDEDEDEQDRTRRGHASLVQPKDFTSRRCQACTSSRPTVHADIA